MIAGQELQRMKHPALGLAEIHLVLTVWACRASAALSGSQIIPAGDLEVSAPPLIDWRVSVSAYGAAVLSSDDGVQTVSLERIRYNTVEDYCYVCVRPSGRPPGRLFYADPTIAWSSPCAQVDSVNNCTLKFSGDGNLGLFEGSRPLWETNTGNANAVSMRLQDTGNLILAAPDNSTVWQSLDHPPDTLGCLPGPYAGIFYSAASGGEPSVGPAAVLWATISAWQLLRL